MEDIKPVPFKKILDPSEFSDGDIIKCVQGTIIKLYKIRSGDGTRGHYEYQDGEIKDDSGTIMGITFASCSQPESAKGKKITIQSTMTESFGKQGVKLEVSTYNKNGEEKESKKLRITSSANIAYGGSQGADNRPQSQQHTGSQQTMTQVHPRLVVKDMMDMHKTITNLVNEAYPGPENAAFRQGATNTLFIEASRQGLLNDFERRYGQLIIPPAPVDPSKWRECVVPKGSNLGKKLDEVNDEDLKRLYSYLVDSNSKTNFSRCVEAAVSERNLIPKQESDQPVDDKDLDDIPF